MLVRGGGRGGVSDKAEQSDWVYACARLCCEFDVCGHGRGHDRGVVNVVSFMCAATGEGTTVVW